ncbi:pupal cuticle protein C1B-like [Chelonus insularis]|uniref:pupal cuticle protein C1B-like n=1 Tax=Chelonus insularis TaxID=460826 RepID=UPI00158B87A5|nr:pupal cuticle protein C1B-like [Chelonus insularis]
MAFKFIVLCAFLATASAGVTHTSTSDNTYRSHGNLATVSTQTKSIETPYSSSNSKNEIRVNSGTYATASPAISYASPAPSVEVVKSVQPTYNYQASAPLSYTQSNYNHDYVLPATHSNQYYSAPVFTKTYPHYQPAYQVASSAPVFSQAYPHAYSQAPVYSAHMMHYAPSPYVHHQPVVKVAYSPAAEVSHFTYSNANDHVSYAW